MTRVLICGGRDFNDYDLLANTLDAGRQSGDLELGPTQGAIIHGASRGADLLASRYASESGIQCFAFAADWDTYGRSAGPRRNQQMLDEGKPDIVIAFLGGRGTMDMILRATKAGVKVVRVSAP